MKLSEKQKEMLLRFMADCILNIRWLTWHFYNESSSKGKIAMLCSLIHNIPYFINRDDFDFFNLYHLTEALDKAFQKDYVEGDKSRIKGDFTSRIKVIENSI